MSSQLHFQNDQKNGALYLHGKLNMPIPLTKINPTTPTTKMNTATMKTMLKAESGELLPPRQPPPRNQPQPLPTSSLQTCRMNIDIGPKIMAQQSWNVWNDRAWPRSITTHPWPRIGCIWNRSQNEIPTTSSSDISSRQEQPNYDRTHNRRSTWILLTTQQCKPIPQGKTLNEIWV